MTTTRSFSWLRGHKVPQTGVLALLLLWAAAATDLYGQEPAAVVNGEPVTTDQLESAIRAQLDTINQQISVLKQTALNRLIDNLLVEQAARAEGVSIDAYMAKYVEQVSVQEAEVNDAFEKSKPQMPATLAPEAKYRIRRSLEDARRADAMRALLLKLRQNADVRNLLLDSISLNLDLNEQQGPSLGSATAPVTVVVFNDFECPFCRSAAPAIRQAARTWGGKVRLVMKNLPLAIHSNAFNAAKAGFCAARENRFWEFFDQVFASTTNVTESGLLTVADSIGLEKKRFKECTSSLEAEHAVQQDINLARTAGVNATPTIFVNKRKLNNVSELDSAIREAMSASLSQKR